MGFTRTLRSVDGAMPSKFECQLNYRKSITDTKCLSRGLPSTSPHITRQRTHLLNQCDDEFQQGNDNINIKTCVQKDENLVDIVPKGMLKTNIKNFRPAMNFISFFPTSQLRNVN